MILKRSAANKRMQSEQNSHYAIILTADSKRFPHASVALPQQQHLDREQQGLYPANRDIRKLKSGARDNWRYDARHTLEYFYPGRMIYNGAASTFKLRFSELNENWKMNHDEQCNSTQDTSEKTPVPVL
jgi:hypothetical protein